VVREEKKHWGSAIVRRAAMLVLVLHALRPLAAAAAEQVAYDIADPGTYLAERDTLAEYHSQLTKIPGVLMVYVSDEGNIVVRVRKIVPEILRQTPETLNRVPIKLVGVEDVTRRHRHELEMISGADHVLAIGVESFPDGQLAIVVRVSQPRYEQPMKVPTNIEGIPLRVLVAQDPLTE
jgi:hypothetical protein